MKIKPAVVASCTGAAYAMAEALHRFPASAMSLVAIILAVGLVAALLRRP